MEVRCKEVYEALGVLPVPTVVEDKSMEHAPSLPWSMDEQGVLSVDGFSSEEQVLRNHACLEVTYELDRQGPIAYAWKVRGCDVRGREIFDRYWYLKGSNGVFKSGQDFWSEADEYSLHVIDDLPPGTYTLTIGLFCMGEQGEVALDLFVGL